MNLNRRSNIAAVLTVVMSSAAFTSARAQRLINETYATEFTDSRVTALLGRVPGCDNLVDTKPIVALSASPVSCSLANQTLGGLVGVVDPAAATATAFGSSSYDPVTGLFKSAASISMNGATLSQWSPAVDASGNRTYDGTLRPDALGVESSMLLLDRLHVSTAAGGTAPTTMSLYFNVDGKVSAPGVLDDVASQASVNMDLCIYTTDSCNSADPSTYFGYAYAYTYGPSAGAQAAAGVHAPVGHPSAATRLIGGPLGAADTDPVTGDLTLHAELAFLNIPITGLSDVNFEFDVSTLALFQILFADQAPCVPDTFTTCDDYAPSDVYGDASADLSHTISFSGYQLFDDAGNDVSSESSLALASGFIPKPGDPSAVTSTPEPSTLGLFGSGLVAMASVAYGRKRRRVRT
jgi:hypothetical protein